MENKKILGGLVVLVVLLSDTTVLYFTGVERPGVTPAMGRPPQEGCEEGAFCAVGLGMGGGCNSRPCCLQGQVFCDSDAYVKPQNFQEIGSPQPPSHGTCWKYDGTNKRWCLRYECNGASCPDSCFFNPILQQPTVTYRDDPVQAGGACDVEAQ